MARPEEDRSQLDEREHQALDTLDSIGPEELATELRTGAGDLQAEAIEGAIATARSLFIRLIAATTEDLLRAAEALAASEDRGVLDPEGIAEARRILNEHPEFAPTFDRAVEVVEITLGLERESLAWALIVELGERAQAEAPEPIRSCAATIEDRLDAAWTRGSREAEPSRALRVFRSATVDAAGPELRARLLAADHPEQLALARALIEADPAADPAALVDRFDAARAALAAEAPSPAAGPEAITDGPKRKFTIVHAILALIILGLTIWHYVFR
ncbi:MAG: hypothetical protein R6X02_28645 [Enhygromyxa sp.]